MRSLVGICLEDSLTSMPKSPRSFLVISQCCQTTKMKSEGFPAFVRVFKLKQMRIAVSFSDNVPIFPSSGATI